VTYAGGHVWVTNYGNKSISKIDPRKDFIVETLFVGGGPSAVVFDGRNIWVASSGDNTVERIEAVRKVDAGKQAGGGPSAVPAH
jgi:DNA-binding beta-propeller fold protein YncE